MPTKLQVSWLIWYWAHYRYILGKNFFLEMWWQCAEAFSARIQISWNKYCKLEEKSQRSWKNSALTLIWFFHSQTQEQKSIPSHFLTNPKRRATSSRAGTVGSEPTPGCVGPRLTETPRLWAGHIQKAFSGAFWRRAPWSVPLGIDTDFGAFRAGTLHSRYCGS